MPFTIYSTKDSSHKPESKFRKCEIPYFLVLVLPYLDVFRPDLALVRLAEEPEVDLHLLVHARVLVVDLLLPEVPERLRLDVVEGEDAALVHRGQVARQVASRPPLRVRLCEREEEEGRRKNVERSK